jgi:hypothetical protein
MRILPRKKLHVRHPKHGGDSLGGGSYADPPPRLATKRQIEAAQRMRGELSGETDRIHRLLVTLPEVRWLKNN